MQFRQKIKAATQPYHDQTEQLTTRPVAEFTLSDYQQFLRVNRLFHRSVEQALADALPELLRESLRWPERQKAPRIQQDLEELGAEYDAAEWLPLPLGSVPEALGAMYVAEGSTLGGMMMKKLWQDHPVIGTRSSFAFLGCYGSETGAYWKSFMSLLEETLTYPDEQETAISSAQATFRFYQTCHQRSHASDIPSTIT